MSQIIFQATLDDKYDVKVTRIDGYTGQFTVHCGELELANEVVPLAYGALFGPDIDDVTTWQNRAIEIVENLNVDNQA